MEFRKQALTKVQSPWSLDSPVQLAPPRSLLALSVVAVLILAGVVWGCTGSIDRAVTAPGLLTHAEGSVYLQSAYKGQVTAVFAETGSTFPANAPLFTIKDGSHQYTIRSATGGRIIVLIGKVGQVLDQGSQLAVIERVQKASDPLAAMVYLPPGSAGLIQVGNTVDLSVDSAPSSKFGVLRGTVQSIDQFPETEEQIANFLGDQELAKRFSGNGQPIGVLIKLKTAPTSSGFAWSNHSGPRFPIDSRTPVSAAIHVQPIKPIDWVTS
jgi:hypothetical protein